MSDTVYTVKVRVTPYPWWRTYTTAIQLLFRGCVEFEGILQQAEWKKDNEKDYSTNC